MIPPDLRLSKAHARRRRNRESVEVHPPHAAAHSLREFLAQLGTITAGVLIALSIEGLLEWNHYRTLREAKATIDLEIADNKKELDGVPRAPRAGRRISIPRSGWQTTC